MPAAFWAALAPDPAFDGEMPFETLARDAFLQQPLKFPPRLLLAGLLAAYIAGVGAFSWLGMRRPWAVVGLFVWLAGAGGGGVFLLDRADFARALTTAEYGVETLLPDGSAQRQTWFGVYAQRREPTVVEFAAGSAVRQLLPADRGIHRFDLSGERGGTTRLRFQAHPQQIRSFVSRWTADPQLAWSFAHGEDGPAVELLSAIPLERAWFLHEGRVFDLGRVEPGSVRRVALAAAPQLALAEVLPSAALKLWTWALDRRAAPTVLGAWHRQSAARTEASATVDATHLVVAEVGS
jgi:hypothetical protein